MRSISMKTQNSTGYQQLISRCCTVESGAAHVYYILSLLLKLPPLFLCRRITRNKQDTLTNCQPGSS